MTFLDTLQAAGPVTEAAASGALFITPAKLRAIAGKGAKDSIIIPVAAAMNDQFPLFGIATKNRIACFLGQSTLESAYFSTLNELGGDQYFARMYGHRDDLGNRGESDGIAYHGRGIFQCTGRSNYAKYGAALGLDLVNHPELAADPAVSVRLACLYWQDRNMNPAAERLDVLTVSVKINGRNRQTGLPNHYTERKALTFKALEVLS